MDCKWIDPIHIREVDSTGLVVGAAFCLFEVLFVAHCLYTAAMAAGAAGLYFRFLP